jgi:hypothetical protein
MIITPKQPRNDRPHSRPVRLRECARSIELLGDASDQALEHLVKAARERFGPSPVELLGRTDVRRRLARIAADRGLEITRGRER